MTVSAESAFSPPLVFQEPCASANHCLPGHCLFQCLWAHFSFILSLFLPLLSLSVCSSHLYLYDKYFWWTSLPIVDICIDTHLCQTAGVFHCLPFPHCLLDRTKPTPDSHLSFSVTLLCSSAVIRPWCFPARVTHSSTMKQRRCWINSCRLDEHVGKHLNQ